MKTLRLISITCLVWQVMLSACKQKDVVPNINQLIGQYDCKFEWYGGSNTVQDTKRFQISKSSKLPNMLEIQIEMVGDWQETWQLEYIESLNGLILMEKQVVRKVNNSRGDTLYFLQKCSGSALGNNLYFEGQRYYEPVSMEKTECKYWAKKK